MKPATATRGRQAERLAALYLQQQGLQLLESNYHCRFGEIDLIMRDRQELVFVEVRLRSRSQFGDAAESITADKQKKLLATASHYLARHGTQACRFDALLLESLEDIVPRWIRNAFTG